VGISVVAGPSGSGRSKPLLFRGGVGVVAVRQHRSRSEGAAAGFRCYAMKKSLSDERNHPNPSFKKERL